MEAEEEKFTVEAILQAKPQNVPAMIAVALNDPVANAVELMRKYDVSQLPVVEEGHVLGTVHDDTVMKKLLTKQVSFNQPVQEVMDAPLPTIDAQSGLSELYRQLVGDHNAVVVVKKGQAFGVLTKMDVISHLSKHD
jgi:cystathionine beta-synthase